MLVMFQTMLFRNVFMAVALDLRDDPNGLANIFLSILLKYFHYILVFILDINMMLVIDFHVLVLQLHMENKLNFKVQL